MKIATNPVTYEGQRIKVEFSRMAEKDTFENVVGILKSRIENRRQGERHEPIDGILLRRTDQADFIRNRPDLIKAVVGIKEIEFSGGTGLAGRTLRIVPLPDLAAEPIAA